MENLTGGTPPVRPLPCVVPCKLYFKLVQKTVSLSNGIGYIPLSEIFESFNPTYAIGVSHPVDLGSEGIALVDVSKDGSNMKIALNKSYTGTKWVSFIAIGSL